MNRNPKWTRDELVLALDVFLRIDSEHILKSAPEILELSALLNAMSIHPPEKRFPPFRDPDGVRRRISYFAQIAAGEEIAGHEPYLEVWKAFAGEPAALRDEVNRIRAASRIGDGRGARARGVSNEELENAAEAAVLRDPDLRATEKEQLVRARRGQGRFRENVSDRECRVTGIRSENYLIASHVKPWRDATNEERLDGDNGLLLAPHVDFLFDRGFISFSDEGDLIVSPAADREVMEALHVVKPTAPRPFNDKQRKYLAYHRQHVFFKLGDETEGNATVGFLTVNSRD